MEQLIFKKSASALLKCYFLQETQKDGNSLLQGVFDIIDEFVEAFGKNADKNINIMVVKMDLFKMAGDYAFGYQISSDLYDLALNIHSRFLEDDEKSYADILYSKVINDLYHEKSWKSEELIESLNKCLKIFYVDEANNKEKLLKAHRLFLKIYENIPHDDPNYNFDTTIMHGRKTIKLERELHGEIRRNEENAFNNINTLSQTGTEICLKYGDTRTLKKIDYDEATGYLLEALAIAESDPDAPLLTLTPYYGLSLCEYIKGEKRNLRNALDYLGRGLRLLSKMDETDSQFKIYEMSKQETIDQFEEALEIITEEKTVNNFYDI